MGVDILSKIEEAILGEFDGLASYHGPWDLGSRDGVLGREDVDPERHIIDNIAHEDNWDAAIYLDELLVH